MSARRRAVAVLATAWSPWGRAGMRAKRWGVHFAPDRAAAPRSGCRGRPSERLAQLGHRAGRRGVPAVRREPPSGRLRLEALSAMCRQRAGAVAHQDVVVASSAPRLLPRVAAWSLAVPWPVLVLWSVVPSGSAAQALQRARRAAAWHRAARPSDARQAGALASSALWARQEPQLAQAELVMRSVREEPPSAAAHAQAAQPWAAVAVPDARAERLPAGAALDAEEPQRVAEAEVSVGAAGLQPAAAVAGSGAAAELRPGAAAQGWDAAAEPRRGVAPSDALARRRRRALRRLLWFSVGTELLRLRRLRDDEWHGLRTRCRTGKLHRRQRGRGKQQETKVCHGGGPRKGSWRRDERMPEPSTRLVDQRLIVRPHCGGRENRNAIYFVAAMGCMRICSDA